MTRHPVKEKTSMLVAVLASVASLWAAVAIYNVPGEALLKHLLIIVVLLSGLMLLAVLVVSLRILLIKYLNRRPTP